MEGINLAGLFQAHLGTGKAAYVDLSGGRTRRFSYDDLESLAARVAGGLLARDLGDGRRVGILADNSFEYGACYLGIPRQGAVVVPLNTKLGAETLDFIAQDAALGLIIGDAANRPKAPSSVPFVEIGSAEWARLVDAEPAPIVPLDPGAVAVQMYTSGSTGRPKGVLLSHRSQLFTVAEFTGGAFFPESETILVSAPMYHKNAMVQTKLNLAMGGEIVLLGRFDPVAYLEAVDAWRCTSLTGVPTMFALMTARQDVVDRVDLSSVRRLMIGSAPMTEALFDQVRGLFPDAIITNGYGTTEAIAVFAGHPQGAPRPKIALGYPIPSVELRLVDAASGADAATDADGTTQGELWIRSPGVMNGYHNLAEVTATRLTDGWYHTGDVMLRDPEGWYFFVGRVDDMFVCAGENIYPGDVEHLLERHPGVHQAAVVPVDDELKGALPVAFVVAEPDADLSEEDVRQWALAHGPAYAHPRAVWLVDEIPLAGTAKIDKTALKAEAARRFIR